MPAALAAAGGLAYLAFCPQSADLAAQAFRADLFARAGFTVFNTAWYGGHHTPAYSVLFPPLGALLGERVLGVLAAVVAAGAFGALAPRRVAVWIVPGLFAALVSGRITFVLGAAVAIAAVLAAIRDRLVLTGLLGVLTALSSPVAALFTGVAAAALVLSGAPAGAPARTAGPVPAGPFLPTARATGAARGARRTAAGLILAAAVAVPTGVLIVAFPEGGTFPFALSAFVPAFVAAIVVTVTAPPGSALRIGGALYALLCLAALVVPSPIGGNATRLGALVAVPAAVHLLWPHRRVAFVALALPLAYWVAEPAVRDVARAQGDASVRAGFYAPVLAKLQRAEARRGGPVRVEVPLTENHGETVHLAPHVALARGWERQVDRDRNAVFYAGRLTPERYLRWLHENAVSFVALPRGVALDPSATAERRIIRSAPAFLVERAVAGSWRLFAVRRARPLAAGSATLTGLGPDSFTLQAAGAGRTDVRLRFSRYWRVVAGDACVARGAGGWTAVTTRRPGRVRVAARFPPHRILGGDLGCGSG